MLLTAMSVTRQMTPLPVASASLVALVMCDEFVTVTAPPAAPAGMLSRP